MPMFFNRKFKYWMAAAFIAIGTLRSNAFAQATGAPAQGPAQTASFFLPLILVFAIFYFLIIRPQQKQAKMRQAMIQAVKKGDQVITNGGIYARVVGVAENILTVEIADNCKVKLDRSAVQSVTSESKSE
jgi:preprotein translocase, YajC subunit